jgi:hypothetical protein
MLDVRLGRFMSLDPHANRYANESPYIFVGDNPNLFVDKNGRDKIFYINVILKDGTQLTVATRREINNNLNIHYTEGTEGGNPNVYFTDVKVTTTFDFRTGKISTSGEESDYSSEYSFNSGVSKFLESDSRGYQEDGYRLTSAFADEADGAKTDSKYSSGNLNIDLIMAALGAASKSATLPDIKEALGVAEAINNQIELKEAIKYMKEQSVTEQGHPKAPAATRKDSMCTDCGRDVTPENRQDHDKTKIKPK